MELPRYLAALVVLFTLSSTLICLSSSTTSITPTNELEAFLACLPQESHSNISIHEAIYTPQNSTLFEDVLIAYLRNAMCYDPSIPKPSAIVTAMHESHVQATVVCATRHGLQLRIRSGGHDFEGLSYVSHVDPFVVLDMFNLRAIHIDVANESAWVESGATIGELYYWIANETSVHGFPAGGCPTVGIGGHFNGGGYGDLLRKYGLTVDNIVDARIINVDGEILDRVSMGEDLFWAIRGGATASFGVVLSWKINLVPVPAIVTVFNATMTAVEEGITVDVLHRWQTVAPSLPNELFVRATLKVANASLGDKVMQVTYNGLFLGQSDELLALLNASFPELALEENDCMEMSWIDSCVYSAEMEVGYPREVLLDRPVGTQLSFKGKSDYVKEPWSKQDLESIINKLLELEDLWIGLTPYGGRMSEISESETPFPHRKGNLFMIQYQISWEEVGIEATYRHLNKSREFYDFMTPFVSKGRDATQVYRDLDIGANLGNQTIFEIAKVYGRKYYKGNFERLVRVKTEVDPGNFFKHEQSIPPYFPSPLHGDDLLAISDS